jgi:hypothetical protein
VTASQDWKEVVGPGEAERLERVAERLRALQRANAAGGKTSRGLHAKAHGGVRATFSVRDGLPDHARHGLFATAQRYDAYVRFSNGSGRRQHDKVDDVRGVAIKVVGVPGKKLIPGLEDEKTQDFLLIQSPSLAFQSPEEFVSFLEAASSGPALLLPRLIFALGPLRPFPLLAALVKGLKLAAPSVALQRYHTGAPIAVGPFAAKLDLVPTSSGHAATPATRDHFAEDLGARLGAGPLKWTLRAQFFLSEEVTPIEDVTRAWPEDAAPFVELADLEIPQQHVKSAEGIARAERVESLSFDPWHALVEHRPLGLTMRARNPAYRLSTQERGAAAEPTSVE